MFRKIIKLILICLLFLCVLGLFVGDLSMIDRVSDSVWFYVYILSGGILLLSLLGTLFTKTSRISWKVFGLFAIVTIIIANLPIFQNARKINTCFDLGGVYQESNHICECGCIDESVGVMDMNTWKCMQNGKHCNNQ